MAEAECFLSVGTFIPNSSILSTNIYLIFTEHLLYARLYFFWHWNYYVTPNINMPPDLIKTKS